MLGPRQDLKVPGLVVPLVAVDMVHVAFPIGPRMPVAFRFKVDVTTAQKGLNFEMHDPYPFLDIFQATVGREQHAVHVQGTSESDRVNQR